MKFMETSIPEIFSRTLDEKGAIFAANHTAKILKIVVYSVSDCLGSMKSTDKPVAFVFKSLNGNFICGAIVEFHPGEDDPTDITAGNWSYVWTFDEEDIKDIDNVISFDNQLVYPFFIKTAGNLYAIKFHDTSTIVLMSTTLMECISNWLNDNAKEGEVVQLIEEGVLNCSCTVEGGEIVKSIIPEGDAKVIIKGDAVI